MGQLVCTGSAASAAVIAPQQRCDFFRIGTFYQFADCQQVPRAAAGKFYIVKPAFRVQREINLVGTDSFRRKRKLFHNTYLILLRFQQGFRHQVAHFLCVDFRHTFTEQIRGTVTGFVHFVNRCFHRIRRSLLIQGITEQHGG